MSKPSNRHQDTRLHSLLKAFSWRIIATLTTTVIAFLLIGEIATAALIGGFEFFIKLFVFYLHERAWQNIPIRTRSKIHYENDKLGSSLSIPGPCAVKNELL